jgi:hypothetical protein
VWCFSWVHARSNGDPHYPVEVARANPTGWRPGSARHLRVTARDSIDDSNITVGTVVISGNPLGTLRGVSDAAGSLQRLEEVTRILTPVVFLIGLLRRGEVDMVHQDFVPWRYDPSSPTSLTDTAHVARIMGRVTATRAQESTTRPAQQ